MAGIGKLGLASHVGCTMKSAVPIAWVGHAGTVGPASLCAVSLLLFLPSQESENAVRMTQLLFAGVGLARLALAL